jgi:kynurenine formamidase
VLLDMAKLYGVKTLAAGTVLNRAELERAARNQHVEIRKGDVVLLHTGWLASSAADAAKPRSESPGLGKGGARYLADLGVVAVGSDTFAVEVVPAEDETEYGPVHQILLAMNGVYLLENMDTRALAADEATEFLFVLGQPRLVGTVQAIVNPIAIR